MYLCLISKIKSINFTLKYSVMQKNSVNNVKSAIGKAIRLADLSSASYVAEAGEFFCIRALAAGTVKVVYSLDETTGLESTLTILDSDVGQIIPIAIFAIVFDSGVVTQETSYEVVL